MLAKAVRNAKAGQVRYRADKNGIVHGGIGKVGFESCRHQGKHRGVDCRPEEGEANYAKGTYVKKVVLSTTMGAGIPIDQASLDVSAADQA